MIAKTLVASLCALALYSAMTLAHAAGDAGVKPPPPTLPNPQLVDKSARCLPAGVNECRASCDRQAQAAGNKTDIAKKTNECKADCIRGC